ncbi:MAG: hypothetical protein JWM59_1146 [Verrucomicrobiales bacterium]|nr:hypothetical protein [Verrucomicrobiales bacterium]
MKAIIASLLLTGTLFTRETPAPPGTGTPGSGETPGQNGTGGRTGTPGSGGTDIAQAGNAEPAANLRGMLSMVTLLDKGRNGQFPREEIAAIGATLNSLDKNSDGRVSREETAALANTPFLVSAGALPDGSGASPVRPSRPQGLRVKR